MTYVWALISGILLGLPFKFPGLAVISWLGLVPFLFCRENKSPKQAFKLGWALGFGFLLVSSYWLIYPVLNFSGYPWPISGLIVTLALMILALYFGLFNLCVNFITEYLNWPLFIIIPTVWTAVEVVRTFFSFQFLFGFIGYTQSFIPQMIQLAEYGGVYLISFLIILVNTLVYQAIKAENKKRKFVYLAVPIIIVSLIFGYGQWQLKQPNKVNTKQLTIAGVQPSIPQEIKLNPSYEPQIANQLQKLSNQALKKTKQPIDLLIWPETAVLRSYSLDKRFPYFLSREVAMLVGGFIRHNNNSLNSSLLIDEKRNITANYSKNKLVPWGEYVPFPKLIPDFIETNLNHITPGTQQTNFKFKDIKFITPICSEILNPFYLQDLYSGEELIINISNEAWFGTSNAPLQVLQAAVFRAVETRTSVVKVGNTGISGVINNRGKILLQTDLFAETTFSYSLSLPMNQQKWTAKSRIIFSWIMIAAVILLLIISGYKLKKSSK